MDAPYVAQIGNQKYMTFDAAYDATTGARKVCGKGCDHSWNNNGTCETCQAEAVVRCTSGSGETATTTYYTDFVVALESAPSGATLTLLKNYTWPSGGDDGWSVTIQNKTLTVDLNGNSVTYSSSPKALHLNGGDWTFTGSGTWKAQINANSYNTLTLKGSGRYDTSVQVGGTITVQDSVYVQMLSFENSAWNATLNGGSFTNLRANNSPTKSLSDVTLPAGYGFKTTSGTPPTWYERADLTDTNTLSNVSVAELPILSVNISGNTSVAYGGSTTLTAAATQPTGKNEVATYQWYEVKNSSNVAISGETGSTLTLSLAGKSAGMYTYRCAVTVNGYTKMAETKVTVLNKVLSEAEIAACTPTANDLTYNGKNQDLIPLTSNLPDGYVLNYKIDDGEWGGSIQGKDAKTYQVYWKLKTIIGSTEYVCTTPVEVTIKPFDLSTTASTVGDLCVRQGQETLTYNGQPQNMNLVLKLMKDAGSAQFTDVELLDEYDYDITGTLSATNAGTYTVTATGKGNYTGCKTFTWKIQPGETQDPVKRSLTVYNRLEKTYTMDLSQLLPTLGEGQSYGTVSYTDPSCGTTSSILATTYLDSVSNNNILTLKIKNVSGNNATTGEIGSISIYVQSQNYESFFLVIQICASDKQDAGVSLSVPSGKVYGDEFTITASTGTEAAAENGTWTWTVDESKLTIVSGQNTASLTVRAKTAGDADVTASYESTLYHGEATQTVSVGKRTITIAAGDLKAEKVYDGTTSSTGATFSGGLRVSGILAADSGVAVTYICGAFSDSNAGSHTASAALTLTPETAAANYQLSAASVTIPATVHKATPTVKTALTASVTYGDTPDASHIQGAMTVPGAFAWSTGVTSYGDAVDKELTAVFTPTDTTNYNRVENLTVAVTVAKATAPAATAGSLTVRNNREHTYTFDLSTLLPTLGEGLTFGNAGNVRYLPVKNKTTVDANYAGIGDMHINTTTGALSLGIKKVNTTKEGSIGKIVFTVSSLNYKDFDLTLNLSASNKEEKLLTVTMEGWTYGGTANAPVFSNPDNAENLTIYYALDGASATATVPTDAGDYSVMVHYETEAEIWQGRATFTIAKATPTGAPKYTAVSTPGKTLADAQLTTVGGTFSVPGTVQWVDANGNMLTGTTEIKANTSYKWTFTPEDTRNYNAISGSVTLWRKSSSSGGSSGTTVTVPLSSDHSKVEVKAEVSKTNATVEISDKQINKVAADGAGTVTLDMSGLRDVTSATVPSHVVEKTNDAKDTGLTVALPSGSVSLDETALESVTDTASGKDVTISVTSVSTSKLPQSVKNAIGMEPTVMAVVDVNITSGSRKQSSFHGGKLTISIPYTPKKGEDTSKLTVWFIRDDGTIENKGGWYDAKNRCFVFETDHLSQYLLVSTDAAQSFTDVPASAYFADAVKWAAANGITGGTTDTTFSPYQPCTRAQIVTFLYRLLGE